MDEMFQVVAAGGTPFQDAAENVVSCSWTLNNTEGSFLGGFLCKRESHQKFRDRMSNTDMSYCYKILFVYVVTLLLQNFCVWYSRNSIKTLTFPEPKWSHMSHEVEEDRAVVVKLGEAAVNSKIQHLCPGFAAGSQIRWLCSFRCGITYTPWN